MTCLRRVVFGRILLFMMGLALIAALGRAQSGAGTQDNGAANAKAQESASRKNKSKHADDFLVRGTVFTPEGLSFAGAEVRIRRAKEKRFRWHAYTNSRGEFAIRVKQGGEYEVMARAKGFEDQKKEIDAKTGNAIDDISFRMERQGEKKP